MNKLNFAVYCILFIGLGILANWYWFPEYLFHGLFVLGVAITLFGTYMGFRNIIRERKKMKAEREAFEKEGK